MSDVRREEQGRASRDRALFDEIALDYAAKDLNPSCRAARRHRTRATLDAAPLPEGADLLEVGCGAGFAAEYLEGRFGSFTGIDYSARLIELAKGRGRPESVWFEEADASRFGGGRLYDAVFMVGVLHHVPDKDALLANLLRSLKPGGWLIANEPQPHNPAVRLARRLRARLDRAYSPEQEQLSQEALAALFTRHGLVDVRVRAQGFLSTPFAEVEVPPAAITAPLARAAVWVDRALERSAAGGAGRLAWNCIAAGRRPGAGSGAAC